MLCGDKLKVSIGTVGITLLKLKIFKNILKLFSDFMYRYILVLKIGSKS